MRITQLFVFKIKRGKKQDIQIFMPIQFLYCYNYIMFVLTYIIKSNYVHDDKVIQLLLIFFIFSSIYIYVYMEH